MMTQVYMKSLHPTGDLEVSTNPGYMVRKSDPWYLDMKGRISYICNQKCH